jgi:DMSO/TMAO reductase YedYZ heme-binding membrane subunit
VTVAETPGPARSALTAAAVTALAAGSALAALGHTVAAVSGQRQGPWILARAAGVTGYALLTLLVVTGLVLAHPRAARLRRPHPRTRLAVHRGLAVFTLVFVALHVVVLAGDSWAGVGWRGAVVPLASSYRPLPVTLGLLGLWSGAAAGATAALAGRLGGRIWFPLHRVAAAAFVLVWGHGVLTGSDVLALRLLYAGTGAGVLVLAVSRYLPQRERTA